MVTSTYGRRRFQSFPFLFTTQQQHPLELLIGPFDEAFSLGMVSRSAYPPAAGIVPLSGLIQNWVP